MLSLRLAPKLDELILANQSAFIKGRTIHDCFRMVQLTCRWLMQKKMSTVFLKIDLARAFDSVSWQFLLELLESLGFSRRWRDWLAGLLFLASSKVLLNGQPGRRICHARGLRQGDPLSPMLFVIVMDVLNRMIMLADAEGSFSAIGGNFLGRRVSLYADDLVLFVKPRRVDLVVLVAVLDCFAGASGLCTNADKCSVTPICCFDEELCLVQSVLGGRIAHFPCNYLGVPLSFKKLLRASEQLLVDKWLLGSLNGKVIC